MIFFLLIWSLCSIAFFALASSMSKHQKQIFGHELDAAKTRYAAFTGWVLLIIALIICMMSAQLSNMISYWIGVLTFSALFVGLCLSYLNTYIKKITIISVVTFALSLIMFLI